MSLNAATRPNTGRNTSEEEAVAAVAARPAEALDPRAIWLFDSRARGDHRPDSDADLLVVAKEGQARGEDYPAVLRPTHETWIGCDVVPCPKADFDEAVLLQASFVADVVELGVRLHEATSGCAVASLAHRSAQRCDADTGTLTKFTVSTRNRSRVCAAALHAAARTG